MVKRFCGLLIMGLAGLTCLGGCVGRTGDTGNSGNIGNVLPDRAPAVVTVNGRDISEKYPVRYVGDTPYLSAMGILQEVGAVALEPESGTLLAVMKDHTIRHVAKTDEVLLDGKAIALSQPSVLEEGDVYVAASLFEKLAARVSTDGGDVTIELAVPESVQRFYDLNEQKQASWFCPDRLFRYTDYIMKNPDLDVEKAVVYVNANLDRPFYTEIERIGDPESLLVLCNKYNQLPADYEPGDLKAMGNGYYLRAEAADAYREMTAAAAKLNLSFQLKSGYRSYKTQTELYTSSVARNGREGADRSSARPGHSEHQTGLAIDVTQPTGDYGLSTANFEKTPQYEWISRHAHEFGFIQRYQADTVDITGFMYEPWHYRYVGKDVAARIYELGITFDEYVAMYQKI